METVFRQVHNELTIRGHRIVLATMGPSVYDDWEQQLSVLTGPLVAKLSVFELLRRAPSLVRWVANVIESSKVDLVLATEPLGVVIAQIALRSMSKRLPVISWLHGPLHMYRLRAALRSCAGHLAISEQVAQGLRKFKRPVYVVGNPVRNSETALSTWHPTSDSPLEILYVGRLENKQKRVDRLLNALAALQSPNWHLTIVGDGPSAAYLRQLTKTLQISHKVRWAGWQNDPWSSLATRPVLALTSDYESFGMVLVEAAMRGIPLLATNCDPAVAEIVTTRNGWLVEPDVESLRCILEGILHGEIDLPSPQTVIDSVQRFRVENVVAAMENALRTLAFQEISRS